MSETTMPGGSPIDRVADQVRNVHTVEDRPDVVPGVAPFDGASGQMTGGTTALMRELFGLREMFEKGREERRATLEQLHAQADQVTAEILEYDELIARATDQMLVGQIVTGLTQMKALLGEHPAVKSVLLTSIDGVDSVGTRIQSMGGWAVHPAMHPHREGPCLTVLPATIVAVAW